MIIKGLFSRGIVILAAACAHLSHLSCPQAQQIPGHVDDAFLPPSQSSTNDSPVQFISQPDGKILVLIATPSHSVLERLGPNGQMDPLFHNPTFLGPQSATLASRMALQADGKILVGGSFSTVDGKNSAGLVRLNGDGTVDDNFKIGAGFTLVNDVIVQPDGKIVIGGRFLGVNGPNLARLESNGAVDTGFISVIGAYATGGRAAEVDALALLPNGSIMVAGLFLNQNFIRVFSDGRLDTTFMSLVSAAGSLSRIAVHGDGFLIIPKLASTKPLFRVKSDGREDQTFSPLFSGNSDYLVFDVSVQMDSKVIVGGNFTNVSGIPQKYVVRLLPDGRVDPFFDASNGPNSFVKAVALSGTNRVLIGGYFDHVADRPRANIAQLFAEDPSPSPPVFLQQPSDLEVIEGSDAPFEASVSGFPLNFQWEHDGSILAGATNEDLLLLNTGMADAGTYTLVVSNQSGMARSLPASLRILPDVPGTNLVLNPSFEQVSASRKPPPGNFFDAVSNWTRGGLDDLFQYPFDLNNYKGKQFPLQGTNYIGMPSSQFPETAITGKLSSATIVGAKYAARAWFSVAENSSEPKVGTSLRLLDEQGHSLALGPEMITNSVDWQPYQRSFIASNPYDMIVIERVPPQSEAGQIVGDYLYVDNISVKPVAIGPPVTQPVPLQVVAPLETLVFTNRVLDTDVTDSSLSFSFANSVPKGMSLDSTTGILQWAPDFKDALSTNTILIRATYNNSPALSSTSAVTVLVTESARFRLGETVVKTGEVSDLPLDLIFYAGSSSGVTNFDLTLTFPAARLSAFQLVDINSNLSTTVITQQDTTHVELTGNTSNGLMLQGTQRLARVQFRASINGPTILVPFGIEQAAAVDNKGNPIGRIFSNSGRLGIVGNEPLLTITNRGGSPISTLYGDIGSTYALDLSTNLGDWQIWRQLALTNFSVDFQTFDSNRPALYIRARKSP